MPGEAAPAANEPILLREDREGVATLTLNRPASLNALSEEMLAELQAALDALATDESVRVVVLAGAGRAFCAGHDLKQMRGNPDQDYYTRLGGRLPAGRDLRPGGRRRGGTLRHQRHQRRPVLLDTGGGAVAQPAAQAGLRAAGDR